MRVGDPDFDRAVDLSIDANDETFYGIAAGFWDPPGDGVSKVVACLTSERLRLFSFSRLHRTTVESMMPTVIPIEKIGHCQVLNRDRGEIAFRVRDHDGQRSKRIVISFGGWNPAGIALADQINKAVRASRSREETELGRQAGLISGDERLFWSSPEVVLDAQYHVDCYTERSWAATDRGLIAFTHDPPEVVVRLLDDDPSWRLDYAHYGQARLLRVSSAGAVIHSACLYTSDWIVADDLRRIHHERHTTSPEPENLVARLASSQSFKLDDFLGE